MSVIKETQKCHKRIWSCTDRQGDWGRKRGQNLSITQNPAFGAYLLLAHVRLNSKTGGGGNEGGKFIEQSGAGWIFRRGCSSEGTVVESIMNESK